MGATTLLILEAAEGGRRRIPGTELGREGAQDQVEASQVRVRREGRNARRPQVRPVQPRGILEVESEAPEPRGRSTKRTRPTSPSPTAKGNLLSCIQSIFHRLRLQGLRRRRRVLPEQQRLGLHRWTGPTRLEPRKRPLHTLSSLILTRDGRPAFAAGCSGGEYRPQQHALLVTNIVDYSMDLEQAIDFPRFLWDGRDGVMVEEGYSGPRQAAVAARGDRIPRCDGSRAGGRGDGGLREGRLRREGRGPARRRLKSRFKIPVLGRGRRVPRQASRSRRRSRWSTWSSR